MTKITGKLTQYGFEWGAATCTRLFSDDKAGWVTIWIKTPKEDLQVYVTRTGKVRIHGVEGEWTKPPGKRKVFRCRMKRPGKNETLMSPAVYEEMNTMVLDIAPLTEIDKAVAMAIGYAKQQKKRVRFEFNSHTYLVKANTNPRSVIRQWEKNQKGRA